jgi:hypothetical protein
MKLLPGMLSLLLVHAAPQWNPTELGHQSTIEFLTVGPEEGEHWSTVWFVVIDGVVYLRLGPRAARRIDQNTTAPRLQVRVNGKEAYAMRYEKAPEKAEAVAAAMRQKYWSDIFGEPFRKLGLTSKTVILRLFPENSR